jgi:hypothetical protein
MEVDNLVSNLNRIENYVAKYIYKKYIELPEHVEQGEESEETDEVTNDDEEDEEDKEEDEEEEDEEEQDKFKYSKKPINSSRYKSYLNTIFMNDRKHIITQEQHLEMDLKNLEIANKEFAANPKTFKIREHKSLPDIKRCNFIRNEKNKLMRCDLPITEDDDDGKYCCRHTGKINMFWENYCKMVKKFIDNQ